MAKVAYIRLPNGTWVPVVPSPSGTSLKQGSMLSITDGAGNVWTLPSTGIVSVNGVPDLSSWGVQRLVYQYGLVWQETANGWFAKSVPLWTTGLTLTDSANNIIVDANGVPIVVIPGGVVYA
jgi:hypothetical protein